MKFVSNVETSKFDKFAIDNIWNHYSKTSNFISFKNDEYFSGDLLGVEDDNGNLIASAVMIHKKEFGCQYSYCQYGFNLDIDNKGLIDYFSKELVNFAKEKGSSFLRLDFNITRLEHEKNGDVVEGGFNHEYITSILENNGYTHLGYNYGYSGNWMSRYTYRLDLDRPLEEIHKGIKRYKQYTEKNISRFVHVHKASYEELNVLYEAQLELAGKLGFKPKELSYFQRLWDCYKPYIHYYVCTTNFHTALLNLEKEKIDIVNHQKILKDDNKIELDQKKIDALDKEIKEIIDEGLDVDKDVNLGAKLIIMQGNNVWNVNMYTFKTLLNFRAAFALHSYAIDDLYNLGAKTYDFEGISGSLDPNDEYYGQNDFKKSFGGDYLEFLGEFDAIFDKKKYERWHKLSILRSKIRRRIRYYLNKKG